MNNLKSLSKKKILFIIILIAATFLIFMVIKENIRHHRLTQSMDQLTQELRSEGLSAAQSSGCGSGQGVYGPTGRSCSMSVVILERVNDESQIRQLEDRVKTSIEKTGKFEAENALAIKKIRESDPSVFWGSGYYFERYSSAGCGVNFRHNSTDVTARLSITCDDSSWFTRTFQFN